jgi:hypothetical protein
MCDNDNKDKFLEESITQLLDTKLCLEVKTNNKSTNTDDKSWSYFFDKKNLFSSVCVKQSKGIRIICQLLDKLQVVYSTEISFGAACHHWKPLPFDIMVVIKSKIGLIEYDGYQHFYDKCTFTKTKEDLINQQTRDLLKTIFTKKHSISLLRIAYDASEKEIQEYVIKYLKYLNNQSKCTYMFSNQELYNEHLKICSTP